MERGVTNKMVGMEAPPRPRGSLDWAAMRARFVPRPPDPAEAANPPTDGEQAAEKELAAAHEELTAARNESFRLERRLQVARGESALFSDGRMETVGREEALLRDAERLRGLVTARIEEAEARDRKARVTHNSLMAARSARLAEWRRVEDEKARLLAEKAARKKRGGLRSLLDKVLA